MGKLDEKVVVVTGASRGIGADIAKLFAQEGGRVICAARTEQEGDHILAGSLGQTVEAIRAAGGDATAVRTDLSKPEDRERLVAVAIETYGRVDVLVNNALLVYRYPIDEYPLHRWMRSWEVNFHAPFHLSQLVLRDMIPRRRGSIVNISSGAAIGPGRGPYPETEGSRLDMTCYGAEKAALERFTQGLAQEVYQFRISVTAVSPTQVVATDGVLMQGFASGKDDPNLEPPELMAQSALLLATEPLDRITGRVTYSQQILKEFGWIAEAVDRRFSGYSQI